MRRVIRSLFIIPFLILVGCSGSEYDDLIEGAINQHREDRVHGEEYTREKADIAIWDNGKYVRISFIDADGNKGRDTYYEVIGDRYEELKQYEGEQLMSKTPDYQEQLGKKLGQ
ncbi:lipoprotein [Niallia circulans]|nr:lipoprotein [Niallia circulans]